MAKVTCPPYDVIDAALQEGCYDLSPYNIVRLILRKDSPAQDKYSQIRDEFNSWLDKGVLLQDKEEAVYFYEQEYTYPVKNKPLSTVCPGEKRKRSGFIALLKIDDTSNSSDGARRSVHAHEHTHLAPKEDRLQLLRQVKANLSPIFLLFYDKCRIIKRLRDRCGSEIPFIDITGPDAVKHKLWRITDSKIIERIRNDFKGSDVFIADGHHRYEVACNFRKDTRDALGNPEKDLACDYVMAYFTDLTSGGLTILPTHRVVKEIGEAEFCGLGAELEKYFDIDKARDCADLFVMLSRAAKNEQVLGMYKLDTAKNIPENKFFLLRLKKSLNIDKVINLDKPSQYKRLAVVILDQLILGGMLNIGAQEGAKNERLFYTNDAALAVKMVDNKEAKAAFFLNPVDAKEMTQLAAQGERMPPKSTFFYPKLLSGLAIYKFNDEEG